MMTPYYDKVAWRIQPIDWRQPQLPIDAAYQPRKMARAPGGCSVFTCLTVIGLIPFLGSLCILMPLGLTMGTVPIWVWSGGLVVGTILTFVPLFLNLQRNTRNTYQNWMPVRATCLDVETHRVKFPDSDGDNVVWIQRLLCEYTYQGTKYTVTPLTFAQFVREAGQRKYLKNTIAADNTCTLWVNPDNPLHTIFEKLPRLDTGEVESRFFYKPGQGI